MSEPTQTKLTGQRVLVLGLGQSGLAMARYAAACNAQVSVFDTREQPPGLQALSTRYPTVPFHTGPLQEVALDDVDVIAWSPGISIERGEGAALYQRARKNDTPVVGELDLFVSALASDENAPVCKVLAVTGTNGKTTVTELTVLLAQAAGVSAQGAGNIGPAMLDAWCDARERDQMPELWVLELSSFQLALAGAQGQVFAPDAAAFLNISQDHQDWHESMASYLHAKQSVAGAQSVAIGWRGQPDTLIGTAAQQRTIGLDEPQNIGDMGVAHAGGISWLVRAEPAEAAMPGRRKKVEAPPLIKRLMPADALQIRGAHNYLNALAALSLCDAVGIEMARMLHALRNYRGAANRCQLIAVIDGVDYYNDSKGTNVGATVAALDGLGKPCWLIAGGDGKGQDFTQLLGAVTRNAAGVLLIGADAHRMGDALASANTDITYCDSLSDAVESAASQAKPGHAVLLSPACASFDMFDNYAHRGEVFTDAVQALAAERGNTLEMPC